MRTYMRTYAMALEKCSVIPSPVISILFCFMLLFCFMPQKYNLSVTQFPFPSVSSTFFPLFPDSSVRGTTLSGLACCKGTTYSHVTFLCWVSLAFVGSRWPLFLPGKRLLRRRAGPRFCQVRAKICEMVTVTAVTM